MRYRARKGREVRSSRPVREPIDVVLIVCEGRKTEPLYFKALCDELKLSTANVIVTGEECGSSPKSIVEYAIRRFRESKEFDRVYCVFDRDRHPSFADAVSRCATARLTNSASKICRFQAVTSNPCFEYWIFLHYEDSDAPVVAAGGKSSGEVMLSKLKRHMPNYEKSMADAFHELKPSLKIALRRAIRINARGNDNPHTKVADLVQYLLKLRKCSTGFEWIDSVL